MASKTKSDALRQRSEFIESQIGLFTLVSFHHQTINVGVHMQSLSDMSTLDQMAVLFGLSLGITLIVVLAVFFWISRPRK